MASIRDIFGIDLRTLALFRILLGLYLLIDLLFRARDLTAHYSDAGIMPRAVQTGLLVPSSWSFHLANGSTVFQGMLFFAAGLVAIGLIVGWRTRLMTVLSWIMLLSVQNRNTVILSGEDNLALLLLFWAMFLPTGARYSLDAALSKSTVFPDTRYASVATAALLLQGMSMYFFSAILKTHPIWVPDGTAVYYALQLDYFVTQFALWFRQFDSLLPGLTYYVYGLELIGPILIFSPLFFRTLRTAMMVAFITMHMAFFCFLEIGLFPYISIVMNLTFLPSWIWDKLDEKATKRSLPDVTIWYDGECSFCEKTCRILRVFLFLGTARIVPAQSNHEINTEVLARVSWVVTLGEEKHFKSDALAALMKASPVFRPISALLSLTAIRKIGDRAYDFIAARRGTLSKATAKCLPWRDSPNGFGVLSQAAAAFFLVIITIQNISTVPAFQLDLPRSFVLVRQALGLYQNWTMFAPYPELTSPWPVIEGETVDGTAVNVYSNETGLASFDKPDLVSGVYANYRWRKFLSNLEDQSYEDGASLLALNYARYLCRNWSRTHEPGPELSTFDIYFLVERTPPPGGEKILKTRLVWSHDCLA